MEENKVEEEKVESYEIKIIDTYIDKTTGALAKDFGKIYKVPSEMTDEKAKELIKKKIARKVTENGEVQAKSAKKSKSKTQ